MTSFPGMHAPFSGPSRPPAAAMMRAEGNLSYLDFIRMVKKSWEDGHPEVPIVPVTTTEFGQYPCITYHLDLRKPLTNEPKPRYREQVIDDSGEVILIGAQRFLNIVTFTAVDSLLADKPRVPLVVEELIEVFDDFIMEFTPVFKQVGASDLLYARRLPDDADDNGSAPTLVKRAVSYQLTTEKIITVPVPKLAAVLVDLRMWIRQTVSVGDAATPDITFDMYDQYLGELE